MTSRFVRGSVIGFGALVVSTLGIFASDALQGIDSRISNLANVRQSGLCPAGMVTWNGGNGMLCIDIYEASPGATCPNIDPRNALESEKNAMTEGCYAASEEGVRPWTYITLTQAQRMCAESGKRLPSSDEWYDIALGTDESSCVVNATSPRETKPSTCVSSAGVYDMVGNVWEWVDETVNGTMYQDRPLPDEGYVMEADASGIAISTDPDTGSALYGDDYFWSKSEGIFGMIRGGFYNSRGDAGLYTVNASVPTNFATQGVGFRCVKSL